MPNGHHGSREEWGRLEAPLRDIETAFVAFARHHGMTIGRNYHNWPERSLRWGSSPERLVQIYLDDEERLTWSLWLCASHDRAHERLWKTQFLRQSIPMGEMSPVIEQLLDEAFVIVNSWRLEDLEIAPTLEQ